MPINNPSLVSQRCARPDRGADGSPRFIAVSIESAPWTLFGRGRPALERLSREAASDQ